MTEGYRAYERFMAVRLHLYSSYDFFKYGGKMRPMTTKAFLEKPGVFFYKKLDRLYQSELDLTEFFLSNLIETEERWIGNLNKPEAGARFLAWRKRIESWSYEFKQDLLTIQEDYDNIFSAFLVPKKGSEYPPALKMYMLRKISIETLIACDSVLDFMPTWQKKIRDPAAWKTIGFMIEKYRPFLAFDRDEMHTIMKGVIHG